MSSSFCSTFCLRESSRLLPVAGDCSFSSLNTPPLTHPLYCSCTLGYFQFLLWWIMLLWLLQEIFSLSLSTWGPNLRKRKKGITLLSHPHTFNSTDLKYGLNVGITPSPMLKPSPPTWCLLEVRHLRGDQVQRWPWEWCPPDGHRQNLGTHWTWITRWEKVKDRHQVSTEGSHNIIVGNTDGRKCGVWGVRVTKSWISTSFRKKEGWELCYFIYFIHGRIESKKDELTCPK